MNHPPNASNQGLAGPEIEKSTTSPIARAILFGGMLVFVLLVLVSDASRLLDPWKQFGEVLFGQGMEDEDAESAKGRVIAWNDRVIEAIGQLENRINLDSPLCQSIQPKVQSALAFMGEGGEEVMIGKDGWLFYRPSFDYLTAGKASYSMRDSTLKGYDAAFAAVVEFSNYLRGRGIELVIVPVPPKLAIHPEKFGSICAETFIEPSSYRDWVSLVEACGVRVFDTQQALEHFKTQNSVSAYLASDTHWRPESMEWVANELGSYLQKEQINGRLEPSQNFLTKEVKMSARGDLWKMLRLDERGWQILPEEIQLRQVRSAAGMKWQSSRSSDVLLLGDSFSNIFSLGQMGWGEEAGFAEHLSRRLGKSVDTILRNSDGAHATRQIIQRDLARGRDRLEGKSLVIWEFAARELTEGIWTQFPYKMGKIEQSRFLELEANESIELEARVVEISPIPVPGSVPYQDFLATVHFRDLVDPSGKLDARAEVLAYASAMEANQWTQLARLRSGQKVKVKLGSWVDAESRYGRWNRSELSEELLLEPVNWLSEFRLEDDGTGSP